MTDEVDRLDRCHVNSMSDALGHECQMMGHQMDERRVLVGEHNDPSHMINLRGIGESLMLYVEYVGTILF